MEGDEVFFDKWNGRHQPIGVLRGTICEVHLNLFNGLTSFHIRVGARRHYWRQATELRKADR